MKILLTADPEIPVPPKLYGGCERVIDVLVRGLIERGHEVILIANRESQVPCRLIGYPCKKSSELVLHTAYVCREILKHKPDVVHSLGRLAYIAPLLPFPIPKVMTYQRMITPRSVFWGVRLSRKTLCFTAISRHITRQTSPLTQWHVVYNGVPTRFYRFQPLVGPEAPLVFLGRLESIKGPHVAIEVAKKTGYPLILMGNVPEEKIHQEYYREKIIPHLDGKNIIHVGPVNDTQKNEILGRARALLMPILFDEPFGLVMAEALACGTPVIAFDRGSVREIVRPGADGFVCDTEDEMAAAVGRLHQIDRRNCRERAETCFSEHTMVEGYEAVYRSIYETVHSRKVRKRA